ncbi:nuclear transport factor 2 family protein [Flavobacterium sp.]|uniref:nuclear transport factor 2 family protein n=1 Tax=Flavobacterium sp. TaxID=239 RepID=UPI003C40B658
MENNSLTIVQNFLKHLTERNLEDLTLLFSENLDWHIPGDESKAEWLGKRNNRKEVSAFYELLWKNTQPISAKIDNIFTDKENAVITGEFSTRMLATDKVVDSIFCIQMVIQNNQIVKYRLLEDSYAVSQALIK